MIFRPGTWDQAIFDCVYTNNEYRVNNFLGKTIVDVGAHIGSFSLLAAHRGASVVYAYEPNKHNFEILTQNALGTVVRPWNKGVHAASGLHLQSMQCSMPENTGGCPTVLDSDGDIETVCMNDIIDQLGHIDILKLDCEGAEYPALLHCTKLDRLSAIVGEYHGHVEHTIDELKHYLNSHGFSVGLEPTEGGLGHFFAIRL